MKYLVSLAPMVDRTDYNFRNFVRMINEDIILYTEMITSLAIINGDVSKILRFEEKEKPLVLQIASSNIEEIKKSAQILKKYNFDEINLNIGCPSDRVQNYKMGAYLMSDPYLVKEMAEILKNETGKNISIKCRIGIDGKGILPNDKKIITFNEILDFINITNVSKYIIHARIAILKGLSPKENRTIPELDYDFVYKIKEEKKDLHIGINGGIKTIDDIKKHLNNVDEVMIGRAIYSNPMLLNSINVLNNKREISHKEILIKMYNFMKKLEKKNEKIYRFYNHTHGLFYGTKYSSLWKQKISDKKLNSSFVLEFLDYLE